MDIAAIIVITVVLMALTGVVIFLIKDYLSYKDKTKNDIQESKDKITQERTTRLGNLKYVVENVNDINNKIYKAYATSSNQMTSNINTLTTRQEQILNGIDTFAKFKSGENNISLLNLPGAVAPDVRLIQHVTMMNGLNINQIGSNVNVDNVMFCNKNATTPRCIKFPDSNGDTVLTSLYEGKRVVLDSESDINGNLNFNQNVGTTPTKYADIKAVGTNLNISSVGNMYLNSVGGKVGIGTSSFTAAATLHVKSESATQTAFRVSCPGTNEVSVDKDGILYVKEIRFGNESNGSAVPKLSSDTNGNLTVSLNGTTSKLIFPAASSISIGPVSGNVGIGTTLLP